MTRKKLILTKEQIEHLTEGEEFVYLSDLASKPDMGDIYSTEITTDGSIDDAYPVPTTTDDKASSMTCDWRGNAKLAGMGASTVRECSKQEWMRNNVFNEEKSHGNKRLNARTFGASYDQKGKTYNNASVIKYRKKEAEKKINSSDPVVRAKGKETLRKMYNNNNNLDAVVNQYDGARLGDKVVQNDNEITPKKNVKQQNITKTQTPKNGVFLN